jgi:hypothetical protein
MRVADAPRCRVVGARLLVDAFEGPLHTVLCNVGNEAAGGPHPHAEVADDAFDLQHDDIINLGGRSND